MSPELIKAVQAAMQAQFQAGYTTAQLDAVLANILPPPTAEPKPAHSQEP